MVSAPWQAHEPYVCRGLLFPRQLPNPVFLTISVSVPPEIGKTDSTASRDCHFI